MVAGVSLTAPPLARTPTEWIGMIDPEPWTVDALCAETDPEMFFVEKGGSTRPAKKVCSECDVVEQCLAYALRNDERFGVWGGLSERERRRLKIAKVGTRAQRAPRIRQLHESGLMDTEIAEAMGLSPEQVGRDRRAMGLRKNSTGGTPLNLANRKVR